MTHKLFRSFNPSCNESRLIYEEAPAATAPEATPAATPPPAKEPEPGSAEARVKGALDKATAAEKRAKEAEDRIAAFDKAAKDEEEAKAKKKGEYEKLLTERDDKLAKLTGEHGTAKQQLEAYEKAALSRIEKRLADVKDEKKRDSIKKLLDGRSIVDQDGLLDEALALVGTGPSSFGGGTPAGTPPGGETKDSLNAELNGFVTKLENGTALTQEESKRQREVERKLQEMKPPTK